MKFLTSIDLSQNEIQNAIMQPLAAPPANPKIGQIYFNSIDLTLYLWTGEKWIPVPTKLSQLENDSKFITAKDVPEGAVASTTTPKMNGTAAVGSETAFARGDHVHPKDTSKLNTDGDGSNVTVAFEAAAKREAPVSGEKLSVLLGKVLKFFSDLKTVAFSGSYKDLTRVAWLNPEMWAELFLENRDYLMRELDILSENLNAYRKALAEQDLPTLTKLLDDGRRRKEEVDGH